MEENMPSDEEVSEIISLLLEDGALEILGYDSVSDQFTYKITDRCKEVYPDLYEAHFQAINGISKDLWDRGIIDIIFTNAQTVVALTEDQMKYIKENILSFEEEERLFLESIMSYYTEDGV